MGKLEQTQKMYSDEERMSFDKAANVCGGYSKMVEMPQIGYSVNLTTGDVMMGAKGEQFMVFSFCPACGVKTSNGVGNCGSNQPVENTHKDHRGFHPDCDLCSRDFDASDAPMSTSGGETDSDLYHSSNPP